MKVEFEIFNVYHAKVFQVQLWLNQSYKRPRHNTYSSCTSTTPWAAELPPTTSFFSCLRI